MASTTSDIKETLIEIRHYPPHKLSRKSVEKLLSECNGCMFLPILDTHAYMVDGEIVGYIQHAKSDETRHIITFTISGKHDRRAITETLVKHVIDNTNEHSYLATAIGGGLFDRIYKKLGFVDKLDGADGIYQEVVYVKA